MAHPDLDGITGNAFLCDTVKIRSQSDNHSVSNVYPQSGIRPRIWPEFGHAHGEHSDAQLTLPSLRNSRNRLRLTRVDDAGVRRPSAVTAVSGLDRLTIVTHHLHGRR